MPSPEGLGKARGRWSAAWDAYSRTVMKVAGPAVEPLARKAGVRWTADSLGFWLMWHLEGGFEGLQRMGMSRSGIYRRISHFRKLTGQHPDEFELPGVSIDVGEYLTAELVAGQRRIGDRDTNPSRISQD